MDIRIVLLPDTIFEKQVKEHSRILSSKLPTLFTLDNYHIPHVTVVHIEFNGSELESINAMTEKIAKEHRKIEVQTVDVKSDAVTYLGVYFKDNSKIFTLRDKISEAISGKINRSSPFLTPHITITRMEKENDVEKALSIMQDFPSALVSFSQLALCESCENSTVSKIYSSFPLK